MRDTVWYCMVLYFLKAYKIKVSVRWYRFILSVHGLKGIVAPVYFGLKVV
jgi:hypothetical protein